MSDIEKIQEEYPESFCTLLEAAYGKGFLSEGGAGAIDALFDGFALENKRVLEIGAGLGGAATHLARNHRAEVTGLEINPAMVDEANRRVPPELLHRVSFMFYNDISRLPFAGSSFDIAFSKGVFLHLPAEDKYTLFKEIFRVLVPGGSLIISDWLSPAHGRWGERMQTIAQTDNLSIVATTEDDYRDIISRAGFTLDSISDDNDVYERYNHDIAAHMEEPEVRKSISPLFSEEYISQEISLYRLLAEAIHHNEMLVRKIVCRKPA
jgi:phosphoethanolamine N-methyltransferase